MDFIQINVNCPGEARDILIAELSQFPFDNFLENETGFITSCENEAFDEAAIKEIFSRYTHFPDLSFHWESVEKVNWNIAWEAHYPPVIIDGKCLVRAAFHEPGPEMVLDMVITPRMSFGTGHHPTTHLMVKYLMTLDFKGKEVLDAGCGTAILAIAAEKLGAEKVLAYDIDEWSVSNALDNIQVNHCTRISIERGTIEEVNPAGPFHIILANINKNVLLHEMHDYARILNNGGLLVLSGFYTQDGPDIEKAASKNLLSKVYLDTMDSWALMGFIKN
jgi:ribosomal protein L11 methyltransferase